MQASAGYNTLISAMQLSTGYNALNSLMQASYKALRSGWTGLPLVSNIL